MRDNTALLTIFNESEYRGQSTECRAVDIYKIYRVQVYTYTSIDVSVHLKNTMGGAPADRERVSG